MKFKLGPDVKHRCCHVVTLVTQIMCDLVTVNCFQKSRDRADDVILQHYLRGVFPSFNFRPYREVFPRVKLGEQIVLIINKSLLSKLRKPHLSLKVTKFSLKQKLMVNFYKKRNHAIVFQQLLQPS